MCLILDALECLELGDWVFSFRILGIFGIFGIFEFLDFFLNFRTFRNIWTWEMVCLVSEFLEWRQSHKQLCSGIL